MSINHEDIDNLMPEALSYYCSPYGNPNPETYAYIKGVKNERQRREYAQQQLAPSDSAENLRLLMSLVRVGYQHAANEIFDYCAENKVSEPFLKMIMGMLDEENKKKFVYELFEKEIEKEKANWQPAAERAAQYIAIPANSDKIVEGYYFDADDKTFQVIKQRAAQTDGYKQRNGELIDLLVELEEYFEKRQDADWQGEETGMVPNKEMWFYAQIKEVLDKL